MAKKFYKYLKFQFYAIYLESCLYHILSRLQNYTLTYFVCLMLSTTFLLMPFAFLISLLSIVSENKSLTFIQQTH